MTRSKISPERAAAEKLMTAEQRKQIRVIWKKIQKHGKGRKPWPAMAFIQTEDSFKEMVLDAVKGLYEARVQGHDEAPALQSLTWRYAAIAWLHARVKEAK